jgi:long-chain-fatty-acid--[acyl-carrier-protein] ligase
VPLGATLPEAFLTTARNMPDQIVVADERLGTRTYRELVTAVLALAPSLRSLPGPYVGLMFPASAVAAVALLATWFAGKIPVMVNWTCGLRGMAYGLSRLRIEHVLTAGRVLERVGATVPGLEALRERFVLLEDLRGRIPPARRLAAALRARLGLWPAPPATPADRPAVVLFTSGSESFPKAVPLTHANLLSNLQDLELAFAFYSDDRLLGLLPPFHSFGLTTTVLLPLVSGLPAVYHPVPTEGNTLARLIERHRATVLLGTPTFLQTIFRAADDAQLASLRAVITGAEKCPPVVYETAARRWPRLKVVEGYGVTECSPVISVNDENALRPGTIGKVLRSYRYALRDPDTGARAPRGTRGTLHVRGPSVFPGYLEHDGPSPFVEWEGATWYCTRDLVVEGEEGVLTFAGRLGRFIKRGGEMISLPAIEAVLAQELGRPDDAGPVLAVGSTPDETDPQIVLFTVRPLERETANRLLRAAGLSALHHIHTVVRVDRIPLLGTGKTDYRALAARGGSVPCSVFSVPSSRPLVEPNVGPLPCTPIPRDSHTRTPL